MLPVGFAEIREMYREEVGARSFDKERIRRIRARILEKIVKQRRKKYFKSFLYLAAVLAVIAISLYFIIVIWGHSVAT